MIHARQNEIKERLLDDTCKTKRDKREAKRPWKPLTTVAVELDRAPVMAAMTETQNAALPRFGCADQWVDEQEEVVAKLFARGIEELWCE
jgi:hypothetical protein